MNRVPYVRLSYEAIDVPVSMYIVIKQLRRRFQCALAMMLRMELRAKTIEEDTS